MKDITKKEMGAVLAIVKNPKVHYNANSLSKVLRITAMGALKILKRLEKEGVLKSEKIGKAKIYKINMMNEYARHFVVILLKREALHSPDYVKRWINEVDKIKKADIVVLFGSVLHKKDPNDIDVLLVTDKKRFKRLQKEIKEINKINVKQVHPIYQSFEDIVQNIKKKHKPLLNAINGVFVYGQKNYLEIYNESRKE